MKKYSFCKGLLGGRLTPFVSVHVCCIVVLDQEPETSVARTHTFIGETRGEVKHTRWIINVYIYFWCSGLGTTNIITAGRKRKLSDITTCWFWSTFRNTVFAKAFLPCSCMFVLIYAKKYSICEGLLEREKRNSKNVTAHSYLFSGKQPRKTHKKAIYNSTHQ